MAFDSKALEKIKKIREKCKECNGLGYNTEKTEEGEIVFHDCVCMEETIQQLNLLEARIPPRYRYWDFRALTEQFKQNNPEPYKYLKNYVKNIESNVDEGHGFWLSSGPGLAKSSIVCYILRRAMQAGLTAYFSRASHIMSQKFDALSNRSSRETLEYIVDDVDILALEELEKVYLGSESGMNRQLFYEFLSDVYDSGKSVLITSNIPRKAVLKDFPPFIVDRYSSIDYLVLVGKSGRQKNGSI